MVAIIAAAAIAVAIIAAGENVIAATPAVARLIQRMLYKTEARYTIK
jgi:hypothetical protein